MSCFIRISEAKPSLTETENDIADFVLENPNIVVNASSQKLAKLTGTSPAAIIRFAKKVGYDGYPQMKIELVKDMMHDSYEMDQVLESENDMTSLLKKIYNSNLMTIKKTYSLLNTVVLESVASKIRNCHTLYLFGIGSSGIVCEDFQQKLLRIGRTSVFHADTHLQLTSVPNMQQDDLAFFISYSGKTKEMVTAAKWVKKMGISSVAITQSAYNDLGKLVDQVITIPIEEKELRIGATSSRMSSLMITDILYYSIAKEDKNQTIERIKLTREIIKEIQK